MDIIDKSGKWWEARTSSGRKGSKYSFFCPFLMKTDFFFVFSCAFKLLTIVNLTDDHDFFFFFVSFVMDGWMDGWMFFRFFETMMLFYSFFTFLKDFTHFIFFFIPAKPKQTPPIYLLSPLLLFSVSVIPSSRKGKKKPTAQYLVGFHFITITFVSSLLDSFL